MKKLFITAIAACMMSVTASAGFFQEEDKQLHMKYSVPFGALGALTCKGENGFALNGWQAIMCGTVLGMIPGIIKEGMDSRQPGNRWDNRDLAADAIGSFIGAVGTITIWEFSSGDW